MQLFTKKISLSDIADQAERAENMMVAIREAMLSPTSGKVPPEFTLSQLAQLCGVAKGSLNHRMRKANLPPGRLNEQGSRREFTLEESIQWIREIRKESLRPAGAEAVTIAMANFKGGTTKTTSAMTLAQGLSLRGHRILVIDCDPQGSISTLFGLIPYLDVQDDQTLLPVLLGTETSVRSAIRPTYWSGIDLIAANATLFSAEFALPARSMKEPTFNFWSALDLAIDDVRSEYDVIIIDTPPALSYLTINALMAANGLIMPLPPNLLDFAASIQFWSLFSDLTGELLAQRGATKEFDFIHIFLSRVDPRLTASAVVRQWITSTYAEKVLPLEIPKTAVADTTSAIFGTVYDAGSYDRSDRTFKRAYAAYDQLVDFVEQSLGQVWGNQTGIARPGSQN